MQWSWSDQICSAKSNFRLRPEAGREFYCIYGEALVTIACGFVGECLQIGGVGVTAFKVREVEARE